MDRWTDRKSRLGRPGWHQRTKQYALQSAAVNNEWRPCGPEARRTRRLANPTQRTPNGRTDGWTSGVHCSNDDDVQPPASCLPEHGTYWLPEPVLEYDVIIFNVLLSAKLITCFCEKPATQDTIDRTVGSANRKTRIGRRCTLMSKTLRRVEEMRHLQDQAKLYARKRENVYPYLI